MTPIMLGNHAIGNTRLLCRPMRDTFGNLPHTIAPGLLRSPGVTLRDDRNGDDLVSRARRSPSTVKHNAEQGLFVAAAEKRAVQPLRARDAARELAVCRENIY